MALTTVSNGNTAQANDLNQVINILQQPSGGQEKGKYYLYSQEYATNASFSAYICSLSRGATPISVTIDEADHAHNGTAGNCNAAATQQLGPNGFSVFTTATGANTVGQVGGNYTIQY